MRTAIMLCIVVCLGLTSCVTIDRQSQTRINHGKAATCAKRVPAKLKQQQQMSKPRYAAHHTLGR